MSTLILAAMFATFILLLAAVVTHRVATASPETPHVPGDCAHCARLFNARPDGGESA